MAEPEYPVLRELETKLKLLWVDTDDYMATQRAIIEVTPDHAYLELPRGRKGDKGEPGNAISFQGIVARTSDLPTGLTAADAAKAWVNTATKALHVWNGSQWFTVNNFAGVDADVQQFTQWFNQMIDGVKAAIDAADRAEYWANEVQQNVTGDFATRNYADSKDWFKGFINNSHQSMSDVPIGLWGIAVQSYAVRLGLPADFGTLQVTTMGSSRTAFFIGRSVGLYINMSQGDVWGEWHQPWDKDKWFNGALTEEHQTMADVAVGVWNVPARNQAVRLGLPMDYGSLQVMKIGLSKTAFFIGQSTGFWINSSNGDVWGEWQRPMGSDGSGGGGGAAGLKTVGMALTAGSLLDGVAGRYRVLTQVTAPVVRWRIHVESRRMLSNTTSAFTLGNVHIGNHSGNGEISNLEQIKSGNLNVAAGGEWVSPWLDASLLANETLIDLNVTGSELYWSQATSWVYNNGAWVSSKNSPVSIWVELETYDQVPVVGMIGDSTGGGQGADRPVFDSALYIAARKDNFIPMAYTYPGSSMESINDYGLHLFQRWAHLDKPDSVIIQSGSNDIHAGTSTVELQTRFANLVETAEMISPVVIGATVKARYPNSGEHQTTLDAHNAFVRSRANGNRDYVDFYQALSPTGTVAAADAADAAHLSTSGHQKLATAFDDVLVARPAWVDVAKELETKASKDYVDAALVVKADQSVITDATHQVGRVDTQAANKLVKLDENGKLYISRHSIVEPSDPVNKIYVDQRTPIESFAGTGSPEGKVTAPVGSVYTDTAATNGAIRWVKTSGTGATGWRVEYGNTGVRNITSLIAGDQGGGVARIQRIGNTVMLSLNLIPTPGEGSFMTIPNFIPIGFRSSFNWQYLGVGKPTSIDAAGPLRVGTNGDLLIYRISSETRINGSATYISDTPWPTTLPGTPA